VHSAIKQLQQRMATNSPGGTEEQHLSHFFAAALPPSTKILSSFDQPAPVAEAILSGEQRGLPGQD